MNQKKQMRYILINSLKGGGAERQVSNICSLLLIDRIFVLEDGIFYDVGKTSVINVSHKCRCPFMINFFFIIVNLVKIIKRKDIVISFLERSNYFNVICKFITHHGAIISERITPSIIFANGIRIIHLFLIKALYPFADLIVVNSCGIRYDLNNAFTISQSKIAVINNCFTAANYSHIISNLDSDKNAIISIGRIDEQKGYWHLLRIMAYLKKMQLHYSLAIIGDGKYRKRLLNYAFELGLTVSHSFIDEQFSSCDNVDITFLGIQHNPFQYVARAKLFVLTSLYEGFPNVVVESMICGTPVMSADCRSGPREILAPDTDFRYETKVPEYAKYGILMPVFDGVWRKASEPLTETEQIWADEIVKVLQDEPLRQHYSELGKKRVQDFSVEKIIPQWEDVIRKIEETN